MKGFSPPEQVRAGALPGSAEGGADCPLFMQDDFLKFVNPLQGTDSQEDFSRGNTLPLVCVPFPMTAWTLQTGVGPWVYRWRDAKVQGIRATHQPSPWMGDYGQFTIMPQTGERLLGAAARSSGYDKESLVVRPDYLRAQLLRYDCTVEVVPTQRCSRMRFRFGGRGEARLLVDCFSQGGSLECSKEEGVLFGCSRANRGGVPEGFALWFVIRIHHRLERFIPLERVSSEAGQGAAAEVGGVEFEIPESGVVECDVATSYISVAQARANLDRELGGRTLESVRAEAQALWNGRLGVLSIDEPREERKRVFYSCLYRTLTFPQKMHEITTDGEVVHYSPYSGSVHPGVLYAGHGFWDTYRTTYPLYALLFPDDYSEFLQGWMNACREGGWYPRWPSPGYRDCMLSTHVDVVFADAIAKGIGGFDVEEAYEGLCRHARSAPETDPGYGRPGLLEYLRLGYIPADRYRHSVAATLDNAYCDFALGRIAEHLGHTAEAAVFAERAQSYRRLFDPAVGLMRGRLENGSWLEPFDPFLWGGPYVEGGAWQTSWGVPHDIPGLIALHGGKERLVARLAEMLATPPHFRAGDYGFEIHEMTEMAMGGFGQYAHSNQPVHHALYLFAEAGAPEQTDYWVHRVLTKYYNHDVGGFPGDEDNGEMSAWYILSSLGIFPTCPGKAEYTLTEPLHREASVRLGNGATLLITNNNAPAADRRGGEFFLNGSRLQQRRLLHCQLEEGGRLSFVPRGAKRVELPVVNLTESILS